MVLVVDAGNSRIKIAVAGPKEIRRLADVATHRFVERPERLSRLFADMAAGIDDLAGAAVSSVVPSLNRPLAKAIRAALGVDVLKIDSDCRFPFRIKVSDAAKVGVDRLAAVAGLHERTSNAVIADVGSAITVDLLRDGVFAGGLIMPGPALGLRALGSYARRLPQIDYASVSGHFPTRFNDTRPSMILGAHIGTLGAVKEAVRFLSGKSPRRPRVLVTGGGAAVLAGRWPSTWQFDPDLVLRGVRRIWILNQG